VRNGASRLLTHPVFVAAVLAAVVAAILGPAGGATVADPDVFWLAAAGRDMVAHHAAPHANVYSYADAAYPWVMHEPLYGLLFFWLLGAFGPASIALFSVLSAVCIVGVAAAHLFARSRHTLTVLVCGLLLATGYHGLLSPRPGYAALLLAALLLAVAFRPGWSPWRALVVVVLELVWTNAHGSFPLGVVLLVATAFDDGRSPRERRAWLATAAAACLVTLVNPYGYRLHGLVSRYLRADDRTAHLIQENIKGFLPLWQGLETGFAYRPLLVAMAVVLGLAVWALARRKHVARAVLVVVGVAMGVYQVRNLVLAVTLGALLLYVCVDDLLGRLAMPAEEQRRPGWLALLVMVPAAVVGSVVWEGAMRDRTPLAWIGGSLGGAAFVHLVDALPSGARVYAPFKPSALVLWYGAERGLRVLYDPRNDCYSPKVARAAFDLGHTRVNADRALDTLDRYNTDYAIVQVPGPLGDALQANANEWDVWRREHGWVVFQRRTAPAPAAAQP
jgi:hypothetical protein